MPKCCTVWTDMIRYSVHGLLSGPALVKGPVGPAAVAVVTSAGAHPTRVREIVVQHAKIKTGLLLLVE